MAKKKKGKKDDRPGFVGSFVGGLICTIILVVVVPVVSNMLIRPLVEEAVGYNAFMWFSSSLIVTVIMLLVMLVFSLLFGGGAILRRYGIIGVLALIAAYWLLGDLPGAIMPVAILILMYIVKKILGKD